MEDEFRIFPKRTSVGPNNYSMSGHIVDAYNCMDFADKINEFVSRESFEYSVSEFVLPYVPRFQRSGYAPNVYEYFAYISPEDKAVSEKTLTDLEHLSESAYLKTSSLYFNENVPDWIGFNFNSYNIISLKKIPTINQETPIEYYSYFGNSDCIFGKYGSNFVIVPVEFLDVKVKDGTFSANGHLVPVKIPVNTMNNILKNPELLAKFAVKLHSEAFTLCDLRIASKRNMMNILERYGLGEYNQYEVVPTLRTINIPPAGTVIQRRVSKNGKLLGRPRYQDDVIPIMGKYEEQMVKVLSALYLREFGKVTPTEDMKMICSHLDDNYKFEHLKDLARVALGTAYNDSLNKAQLCELLSAYIEKRENSAASKITRAIRRFGNKRVDSYKIPDGVCRNYGGESGSVDVFNTQQSRDDGFAVFVLSNGESVCISIENIAAASTLCKYIPTRSGVEIGLSGEHSRPDFETNYHAIGGIITTQPNIQAAFTTDTYTFIINKLRDSPGIYVFFLSEGRHQRMGVCEDYAHSLVSASHGQYPGNPVFSIVFTKMISLDDLPEPEEEEEAPPEPNPYVVFRLTQLNRQLTAAKSRMDAVQREIIVNLYDQYLIPPGMLSEQALLEYMDEDSGRVIPEAFRPLFTEDFEEMR